MADKDNRTHFGFRTVEAGAKAGMVRGVFDSVASKYDVMNDLMSLGIHRLWKRFAVELAGVRRGQRILDLASGTGDLADRFADLLDHVGRAFRDRLDPDTIFVDDHDCDGTNSTPSPAAAADGFAADGLLLLAGPAASAKSEPDADQWYQSVSFHRDRLTDDCSGAE